jgi:hypothetical protein
VATVAIVAAGATVEAPRLDSCKLSELILSTAALKAAVSVEIIFVCVATAVLAVVCAAATSVLREAISEAVQAKSDLVTPLSTDTMARALVGL